MSRLPGRGLRSVALRKALHIALCGLLLVPFTNQGRVLGIDPLTYYAALALIAATLNSYQVKRGLKLSKVTPRLLIKRFMASSPQFPELSNMMLKLERLVEEILEEVEREYERKSGYVGVTFGAVGVLASYALFRDHALMGILALAVVDPAAALVGSRWGRIRVGEGGRSLEGSVAGALVFLALLVLLGQDPASALILAAVASLSEAISVEDNLVIPVAVSATSYVLNTFLH